VLVVKSPLQTVCHVSFSEEGLLPGDTRTETDIVERAPDSIERDVFLCFFLPAFPNLVDSEAAVLVCCHEPFEFFLGGSIEDLAFAGTLPRAGCPGGCEAAEDIANSGSPAANFICDCLECFPLLASIGDNGALFGSKLFGHFFFLQY
jgi:hypothetical protein